MQPCSFLGFASGTTPDPGDGKAWFLLIPFIPGGFPFPRLLCNLTITESGGAFIRHLYKVYWKADRPKQFSQLTRKLAPLVLSALIAVAAFFAVANPLVQQKLNQTAMQALSSRFLQVVDGYFLPLFQFMSSASLWTRVGTIDSLGNPEDYVEALYKNLDVMESVSTLSMSDAQNKELVLRLLPEDGYEWYETVVGADDSLITLRDASDVSYLNLGDVQDVSTSWGHIPLWFRFSTPYMLPGQNVPGSTIRARIGDRDSDFEMKIWLDLPLSLMSESLKNVEKFPETIVFLLLPGDEFLMFTVDELLALNKGYTKDQIENLHTGIAVDKELVAQALRDADVVETGARFETSFVYNNRRWRADYRKLPVGSREVLVGTFIPVESLWTSDFFLPVQLAFALIFGFIALLTLFIIRDFRRNAISPGEEELLRKLIDEGESASLEFKSSLRWDFREEKPNKELETVILKSIAAFSNHQGGTLLIGVSDDGESLGLQPDYSCLKDEGKDYFELHLRNLIVSQYGVGFASEGIRIRFFKLDEKEICRVDIHRGKIPLYTTVSVKGAPPAEKFFVRSGNSSRAINSMSEVTGYVMKRFGRRILQ